MEEKTEEKSAAAAPEAADEAAAPHGRTTAKPQTRIRVAILVAVCLLVYLPGLFRPALMDDADTVHAESAKEMILRHDWVSLYADGVRYLQKAPLMYWVTAASYEVFGISEWSTRLVLLLSVLALLATAWIFGRRFFGELGGFYAALILATAPGIYVYTRFLIPNVLVAMWLALGFYFFLAGYEQREPSRWMCWGLAATAALNVLTMGLIGLAFPGLIVLVFLALVGDLGYLKKMRLFSSALVFLIVAVPWHVLAAIRNPAEPGGPEKGFLWFYFINEQFLRYLNQRIPHDYGKVPLGVFWALALLWIFPWFLFLVPALREAPWRPRLWRQNLGARARANLFLAIWALTILVFFSFSSRQEYYSLPAVPALALLVAGWLERETCHGEPARALSAAESGVPAPKLREGERRTATRLMTILLVIGAAGGAVALTLFALSKPVPAGTDIARVLTVNPSQYRFSLGHLQDLTFASLGAFRPELAEVALALLVGPLLAWLWRRRGFAWRSNLALAGMMVVLLLAVHQALVTFSPELSSKRLAETIDKYYQSGDAIVINGSYAAGSSLNFYTGRQVSMLDGGRADLWFGSLFHDAPRVFEDRESFDRLWNGPHRVFLFTVYYDSARALAGLDPHSVYFVAREGDKELLTNRPLGSPPHAANYVPPHGAS